MKKALTVFLMLALIGAVYADEPVVNVNVSEFTGNAAVSWGIDLDSGKTGFKNEANATLKLNLIDGGNKSTSGDGIWGELVIKTDGDTFLGGENVGLDVGAPVKAVVDVAKLHFGPVYVGIKSGDTEVGELKMDAAIRSADSDNAVKVPNVGPTGFTQGIVIGYANDLFGVDVDFRSYEGDTQYTGAYSLAAEAKVTPIEGLEVKGGVAYNISNEYYNDPTVDTETAYDPEEFGVATNVLGYSASVGYKLGLNDTMYVRPQVGFTGMNASASDVVVMGVKGDAKASTMTLAAGVLFGWGDIGVDANAGVPYLDGDSAKKVSPGVGVVVEVPFDAKAEFSAAGNTLTGVEQPKYSARIMPSFYSGDLLGAFKAAAYADIAMMKEVSEDTDNTYYDGGATNKDMAMAFALGLSYAAALDEITITPSAGVRFANGSYMDNGIAKDIFSGIGDQKKYTDGEKIGMYDGNFMNLKVGVDVAGLIQNTTLSVIYESRNLMNGIDYADPANPQKAGTLNIKAKIAF